MIGIQYSVYHIIIRTYLWWNSYLLPLGLFRFTLNVMDWISWSHFL